MLNKHRNLTDKEFIHELSLSRDPMHQRLVRMLSSWSAVEEFEIENHVTFDQDAGIIHHYYQLGGTLDDWLTRLDELDGNALDYLEGVVQRYEMARLWVCTDCLQAIAYDDYSGLDYHYDHVNAPIREIDIRNGISRLGPLAPGERQKGFNIDRCECCGSILAGDRFEVFQIDKVP